jgi:hypothetical protein
MRLARTLRRQLAQVFVDAHPVRRGELGQAGFAEGHRERTAACDLHAVGKRLRQVREERCHLLARLEVLLRREATNPTRVGQDLAVGDADTGFMGAIVVAPMNWMGWVATSGSLSRAASLAVSRVQLSLSGVS